MAEYSFEYRTYKRRFKQVLKTAHGTWVMREGILIKVQDAEGNYAYGECAPLEAFGTESCASAIEQLKYMRGRLEDEASLDALEVDFPCLRGAFDMALMRLNNEVPKSLHNQLPATALLPEGFLAIDEMKRLMDAGYVDFKWKVGREPVKENAVFLQLLRILPKEGKLRVDANGAFDRDVTRHWLRFMEGRRVAWLEQPMKPDQVTEMRLLAQEFRTPIALDESVARVHSLEELCESRWRGYVVVKPAIMGSLKRFLSVREKYQPKLVYSTAFETSIGLQYLIDLAASDPQSVVPPLGLGGEGYFGKDAFCIHDFGAQMGVWRFNTKDFDPIWDAAQSA